MLIENTPSSNFIKEIMNRLFNVRLGLLFQINAKSPNNLYERNEADGLSNLCYKSSSTIGTLPPRGLTKLYFQPIFILRINRYFQYNRQVDGKKM